MCARDVMTSCSSLFKSHISTRLSSVEMDHQLWKHKTQQGSITICIAFFLQWCTFTQLHLFRSQLNHPAMCIGWLWLVSAKSSTIRRGLWFRGKQDLCNPVLIICRLVLYNLWRTTVWEPKIEPEMNWMFSIFSVNKVRHLAGKLTVWHELRVVHLQVHLGQYFSTQYSKNK